MATVHVVGCGLAGLACAVRLVDAGHKVELYDAAGHAGGRCRSFFEPSLGRTIDNGNHLLFAGNDATMAYLEAIGARRTLLGPPSPAFPFVDVRTGARWTIRPNAGRLPWWLLVPSRRAVPGSRPAHLLVGLRLARAGPDATVADVLDTAEPTFERFWQPLAVAALNAAPEEGAARLLWPVVALTFGRGGRACHAYVAAKGLSHSLVDPAVAWLVTRGCAPHFGERLRRLEFDGGRAARLDFTTRTVEVGRDDDVVLALPPARLAAVLPGVTVPRGSRAIVNAHFRLPEPVSLPDGAPFLGLVGASAQWVFVRGDVASVTVSAADAMLDAPAAETAATLWRDVARALALGATPLPAYRVVKERRATFAQTPAEVARRPRARTRYVNVLLAGDWTDTGLPASIESAVHSGRMAAGFVLARRSAP